MTVDKSAKTFEELRIWQKAHKFVLSIYKLTDSFPQNERFGLIAQLRRSAASIPANFAEGFRKKSKADKLRFYNIAQASISESQYHLILANDLNYANTNQLLKDLKEIDIMLDSYMKKIKEGRQKK